MIKRKRVTVRQRPSVRKRPRVRTPKYGLGFGDVELQRAVIGLKTIVGIQRKQLTRKCPPQCPQTINKSGLNMSVARERPSNPTKGQMKRGRHVELWRPLPTITTCPLRNSHDEDRKGCHVSLPTRSRFYHVSEARHVTALAAPPSRVLPRGRRRAARVCYRALFSCAP